jgi:3-methyladenine DNA glycosylase Mpg
MGLTLAHNRLDLGGSTLYMEDRGLAPRAVAWSPRIGISVGTEHHWRCFDVESRAVSGRRQLEGAERSRQRPRQTTPN